MNKFLFLSAIALLVTLAPMAGCQQEGPGEQVGKSVDNAARAVKDAAVPPGPTEKAGRAVDDMIKK